MILQPDFTNVKIWKKKEKNAVHSTVRLDFLIGIYEPHK